MSKKVLIIVSNANVIGPHNRRTGSFLSEVAHPYEEFSTAGCVIDFASLSGDTPYLDALHLADDPANLKFLTGKGWADMQKAVKLATVDVGSYDAIFVPGGLAPMVDMPEAPLLKKVVQETYERQAIVAAVCHGPVALLNTKLSNGSYLVEGKQIAAFSTKEEDDYARRDVPFDLQTALAKQGAILHPTPPWTANSVRDGNLVTGQNPASAKGVGEKVVALLKQRTDRVG